MFLVKFSGRWAKVGGEVQPGEASQHDASHYFDVAEIDPDATYPTEAAAQAIAAQVAAPDAAGLYPILKVEPLEPV